MRGIRLAFSIGITVFLLIIVTLLLLAIREFFGKGSFSIDTSQQAVVTQLRKLDRLETASFTIEKVISAGTNGNAFSQLLFGDRILLIAHGQVIAGFDLSQLQDQDIAIHGQDVTLTLPAPKILVTSLDNGQTRVYDRRKGLLTKGNDNLESEARKAASDEIEKAACQGHILDEASKNAKSQMTALLQALKFKAVTIIIPQGSC